MISRKQLYAAGETLGEGATRHKLGGGYVCGDGGGGGSSSSATSSNTTTTNKDNRQVLDGGSVGVSGDRNTLGISSNTTTNTTTNTTVNTVDSTSVAAGRDVALSALATNATNVDHLLGASEQLFSQIGKNLEGAANLTSTLAAGAQSAYSDATAQATGNKQLMMVGLAVIGLAAVATMGHK